MQKLITFLSVILLVVTAMAVYQRFATARVSAKYIVKVEKGIPEIPSSSKELEGGYFQGDRKGFNFYLDLRSNGTYRIEWHSCGGFSGESEKEWELVGNKIIFTMPSETNVMRNFIRPLETHKFNGNWILVRFDKDSREFYDRYGVTEAFCYQRQRPSLK
jgi:hypothetical protein